MFWKNYLNFTLIFPKLIGRKNRLNRFEIAVQQRLAELKRKQKMFAPYKTVVIKSLVLVSEQTSPNEPVKQSAV